jgi:NarL family two-component system response regulator LiaR
VGALRRVLLTGVVGGLLIAALSLLEYRQFVRAHPGELYGGLVAILFSGLGVYFGRQLRRGEGPGRAEASGQPGRTPGPEAAAGSGASPGALPVARPDLATGRGEGEGAALRSGAGTAVGRGKEAVGDLAAAVSGDSGERLRALGITPREHEILLLIAEGLSNREIGSRVFISENTVKTHSSRLFEKLGVRRRVQAVQRARALGLVP